MKRLIISLRRTVREHRILAITVGIVAAVVVFAVAALTARMMTTPDRGRIDADLDGVVQPTTAQQPTATTPSRQPPATPVSRRPSEGPCWPTYGRNAGRLSDARDLRHGPPRARLWSMRIGIMEFPPAFCDGVLYVNSQRGVTSAIESATKRVIWRRQVARTFDSTPAVTPTRIVVGSYEPGTVQALDRNTGRRLWTLRAGGAVESSPVVVNGLVYATSKDHRIYAIDEATGRVRWAFRTSAEIKDSPSVANGMVYFGNYAAEVYALDARTGAVRWRRTFGGVLGDRVYASVAVRGGTAWFATVRGDIYALNARTGATRWHRSIPGYVYATPAVSEHRLFIGNYPGRIHAFDARTGRSLWSHDVGGSISGSPTVIGRVVYVSSLSGGRTIGFATASGRPVWRINQGRYVSGIATDRAIYLSLGPVLSRWVTDQTKAATAPRSVP